MGTGTGTGAIMGRRTGNDNGHGNGDGTVRHGMLRLVCIYGLCIVTPGIYACVDKC